MSTPRPDHCNMPHLHANRDCGQLLPLNGEPGQPAVRCRLLDDCHVVVRAGQLQFQRRLLPEPAILSPTQIPQSAVDTRHPHPANARMELVGIPVRWCVDTRPRYRVIREMTRLSGKSSRSMMKSRSWSSSCSMPTATSPAALFAMRFRCCDGEALNDAAANSGCVDLNVSLN